MDWQPTCSGVDVEEVKGAVDGGSYEGYDSYDDDDGIGGIY